MPTKPEASHKAERDAALFEKFNATFFEEFLWSGDETVKVDTAKLIELFDRYFESEDYPTLDELRKTVSFIATFTEEGVNYDHFVHYPKDFDEVSDFFEENLEGSFKAGLDACRNQSRSSKSAHFAKEQAEQKPLPADPKKLVQEYPEVQKRIDQLKNEKQELVQQRNQILAPFPRLKVVWEDEWTREPSKQPVSGAKKVRMYLPRSHRVETVWKLPTQAMTEDEEVVQKAARKLFLDDIIKDLEIERAKQRLSSIEAKAAIDGVTLPEGEKTPKRSEIESSTRKKRPVPESVSTRRALVKAFDDSNPKIKNLDQSTCDYLDEKGILVRPEWQTDFQIKTWAEAYGHPRLKNRIEAMFSKDRKKG